MDEERVLQHYAELKRVRDKARRLFKDGAASEEEYTRARFDLSLFRYHHRGQLDTKLVTSPVSADLQLLLSMDPIQEDGWVTVRSIKDCVARARASVNSTFVKVDTADYGDKVLWVLVQRLIACRLPYVILSATVPTPNAEASLKLWHCFQLKFKESPSCANL